MIERYKEYPVMARKGRIEGTVVIQGTLTRDGSLRQYNISRTSKSRLLDNAALLAVRTVESFPPVPTELLGDGLVFELPVSFRLSTE
jgi:periplasmic protein TonB